MTSNTPMDPNVEPSGYLAGHRCGGGAKRHERGLLHRRAGCTTSKTYSPPSTFFDNG